MKLCIVSGGQTGVDRAALDAALQQNYPCAGWCPAGRLAEDGPIEQRYPLQEMKTTQYLTRTRRNVVDSDGTLIIYFSVLQGGTKRTLEFCQQESKPYLLLDLDVISEQSATKQVIEFTRQHQIRNLNVAGPRASKEPKAYPQAYGLITQVLEQISE